MCKQNEKNMSGVFIMTYPLLKLNMQPTFMRQPLIIYDTCQKVKLEYVKSPFKYLSDNDRLITLVVFLRSGPANDSDEEDMNEWMNECLTTP